MDGIIGFGMWLLPKFTKPRVRQIVLSESQMAELNRYGFVTVDMRTAEAPLRNQNLFCGEYRCHCCGHSHDEASGTSAVSIRLGGV